MARGDAERLTAPDHLPRRMRTGAELPRIESSTTERHWLELPAMPVIPERMDQLSA